MAACSSPRTGVVEFIQEPLALGKWRGRDGWYVDSVDAWSVTQIRFEIRGVYFFPINFNTTSDVRRLCTMF